MDFGFARFLLQLETNIMTLLEKVQALVSFVTQKEAEYLGQIADLRSQLEAALADDAADDAAVAAAQAEAEAAAVAAADAQARAESLQTLVDADVAEDQAIVSLIDSVLPAAPVEEPPADEQPAPEPPFVEEGPQVEGEEPA